MDIGIILSIDKSNFYNTLEKNTGSGTVNFIIDPSGTLSYETIDSNVNNKIFNKDNLKIFHSIVNKKVLNVFLDRMLNYNIEKQQELSESITHYVVYIYYNGTIGDPNHILNEYHQRIKGSKMSIVLLIDSLQKISNINKESTNGKSKQKIKR